MWWKKTATVAAAVVVAGGGGVAAASADPPPPPSPQTSIDRDGTFLVGIDVAPGTYSSAGPVGSGTCYWKRLSSGDDIVDNAMTKKAQVVRIDATDKAFTTSGCQPWQQTNAAPEADLPPWIGGAQLHIWMETVNSGARQYGEGPPPPP